MAFNISIGSNNKCIVNGKKINLPPGNVNIINNEIFVNGKKFIPEGLNDEQIITVKIEGDVDSVQTEGEVTVKGNVGKIKCGCSVEVTGNVNGNIDCGNSVSIKGDMTGDIDCGNSVNIKGSHNGDIDAGGSVRTGK